MEVALATEGTASGIMLLTSSASAKYGAVSSLKLFPAEEKSLLTKCRVLWYIAVHPEQPSDLAGLAPHRNAEQTGFA